VGTVWELLGGGEVRIRWHELLGSGRGQRCCARRKTPVDAPEAKIRRLRLIGARAFTTRRRMTPATAPCRRARGGRARVVSRPLSRPRARP